MKRLLLASAIILAISSLSSCDKGTQYLGFYDATVTIKPLKGSQFDCFFQQDEHTAVVVNTPGQFSYSGDEERAYIHYYLVKTENTTSFPYPDITEVWYVDLVSCSLLHQKQLAESVQDDDEEYGNEPVEVICGDKVFPSTSIEDGYLNLVFQVFDADLMNHTINVVKGSDPSDPYKLVVHHKLGISNGETIYPFLNAYLFCFPLKELPDTGNTPKKVTIEWKDFSGKTASCQLDYISRKQ
ncbi:MAG: hypothetical protein KBT00_07700 [Bacteroidales bacterium]|nr:hypothetical protein [Candidatus Cacconaster merdequi]